MCRGARRRGRLFGGGRWGLAFERRWRGPRGPAQALGPFRAAGALEAAASGSSGAAGLQAIWPFRPRRASRARDAAASGPRPAGPARPSGRGSGLVLRGQPALLGGAAQQRRERSGRARRVEGLVGERRLDAAQALGVGLEAGVVGVGVFENAAARCSRVASPPPHAAPPRRAGAAPAPAPAACCSARQRRTGCVAGRRRAPWPAPAGQSRSGRRGAARRGRAGE
jgi:hypothetical protein